MTYEKAVFKIDLLEKSRGFREACVAQFDMGTVTYGITFEMLIKKLKKGVA